MSATGFIRRRNIETETLNKATGNSILELKTALEEETKKTRKRRSEPIQEPTTETPQEPAAETQQEITNADS